MSTRILSPVIHITNLQQLSSLEIIPKEVAAIVGNYSTYQLSFNNQIVARLLPKGFDFIAPRFSCCGERYTVIIDGPSVFVFDTDRHFISQFTFHPYVAGVCIDNKRDLIFLLHSETDIISQPLHISSFDTRGKKITSFSLNTNTSLFGLKIMKISADGSVILKTSGNIFGDNFAIHIWSIHGQLIRSMHFPLRVEDFDVGPGQEIFFSDYKPELSEEEEETITNTNNGNENLWKINEFGKIMFKLAIDFHPAGIFCDSVGNVICFNKSAMHVFSSDGTFMGQLPVFIDLFQYNPSMFVSDSGKISICVGTVIYC